MAVLGASFRYVGRWLCAACLVVLAPASAEALLGVEFGGWAGSAGYSGDVFSGDLKEDTGVGSGPVYGARLGIRTLPVVDLTVDVTYASWRSTLRIEEASDTYAYDFFDIGVDATLQIAIWDPPLSPVSIYVGGGGGLHLLPDIDETEISGADVVDAAQVSFPSGHAVAGIRFDPPALPFSVFAEGRYGAIFLDDEELQTSGGMAGLALGF